MTENALLNVRKQHQYAEMKYKKFEKIVMTEEIIEKQLVKTNAQFIVQKLFHQYQSAETESKNEKKNVIFDQI
jgi:hypothetical protein